MKSYKNTVIFGDSYSTFLGYIPEHYAAFYWQDPTPHGVSRVEQTWWYQLMSETGSKLILNDSWSGSCICHTGYDGEDCSETSSFVFRLDRHIKNGFFEKNRVDTVFVFGGTNDSWSGAPLGELQYSNWEKSDLYKTLPASCYFMDRIKKACPDAEVIWVINDGLKEKLTGDTVKACEHYGINCILLENIDKLPDHPTPKGMIQIKEQIINNQ
ncbi:MAG: hypothetical protein E7591_03095 [Ruminococcaceae bacterium]|nr:hypothetical protein [Oscillospiraceae bacterium]